MRTRIKTICSILAAIMLISSFSITVNAQVNIYDTGSNANYNWVCYDNGQLNIDCKTNDIYFYKLPQNIKEIVNDIIIDVSNLNSYSWVNIQDDFCNATQISVISNKTKFFNSFQFINLSNVTEISIQDDLIYQYLTLRGCNSITAYTIPSNVKEFFVYDCVELKSLNMNEGLRYVEIMATPKLNDILLPYNTDQFSMYMSKCDIDTMCIPATGEYYLHSDSLTDVTFLYGRDTINDWSLSSCDSLTNIIIPSSVTTIEYGAFSGCSRLKSITLPDSVKSIGPMAFSSTAIESFDLPVGVKKIDFMTFGYCDDLSNIIIPSSVTDVEYGAFILCSNLNSVSLPDSVKSIGPRAFFDSGLTSFTIPGSVKKIDSEVFRFCADLKSINIPTSVTSIYSDAFLNCPSLRDVYYGGTKEQFDRISVIPVTGKPVTLKELFPNATIHYSDESDISIKSQPEDYYGFIGDTAVFKVLAEGAGLTYQWQVYKNGTWKNTSLPGNQTKELNVGVIDSRNGMKFRCVINDCNGNTATSNEVSLKVSSITILTQPENYTGFVGTDAIFSVKAQGKGLTYQWQVYKNGAWKNTSLPGNQTNELLVGITDSRNGMKFRCVIKSSSGDKKISDEVTLNVESFRILTQPEDVSGIVGENANFYIEAEAEGNVTYQWQVYKNGTWKNTSLSGSTTDTLSVQILESRDGMKFRCVIKNEKGNKLISDEVTLSAESVYFYYQPEDYTASIGEIAEFYVAAEGEDLTYQWQVYKNGAWKNTSLPGNKTDMLEVEALTSRDGMQFRCVVTDVYGTSIISVSATLSVLPIAITDQPDDYIGAIGETVEFYVGAEGDGLTYQWQVYKNGAWKNTSLPGNDTDTLSVEVLASRDGMEFRCIVHDAYGNALISDSVSISIN